MGSDTIDQQRIGGARTTTPQNLTCVAVNLGSVKMRAYDDGSDSRASQGDVRSDLSPR